MIRFNTNIIPKTKGAYVVGGSIRDILANRVPSDYDFAVLENPKEFAVEIAEKTNGHVVTLGKPGLTIYRVASLWGIFDVSVVNGSSIEEDLSKRDFTINAMAVDLSTGVTIDPFNGLNDLENKTIRMVSEEAFHNDPIRLLRAYRLGAIFNFKIEKNTENAVKENHALISRSAGERIHGELIKIFETNKSFIYLEKLFKNGLLFKILPEISSLHHNFTSTFKHTLKAYKNLETIINKNGDFFHEKNGRGLRIKENAGLLKYAMLLHEIGKPYMREDQKNQSRWSSEKGAEITEEICNRLRFSSYEKNYVSFIVKNHLEPLCLFRSFIDPSLPKAAKIKFFIKCQESVPDLILHGLADITADNSKSANNASQLNNFARDLINDYYDNFLPVFTKKPILSGNDLIKEFNLPPSPFFKKILDQVEESRLSGQINSKSDAVNMVRSILDLGNNNSSS